MFHFLPLFLSFLQLRCRKWPRFTFTAGRWITSSRRCRRFGTAESTSTKGIFPVSVRFGFRDVAEVDVSKLQHRQRKVHCAFPPPSVRFFTNLSCCNIFRFGSPVTPRVLYITYEYFLQSSLSVSLFLMSSYVCIFPVKRQQLKNDHIRHPCFEQNLYQNNKTKITIPPPMNQPPNKNHNHQLTSARYDPKELINFLDSKKWRRQRSLVQKGRKYAQAVVE